MSKFTDIVDMYMKVFGTQKTKSEIERLVEKNLRLPSSAPVPHTIPYDQIFEDLQNLQTQYRDALRIELEGGLFGSQRKRMLELALESPTMDLSLISSQAERSRLDRQFQDIVFQSYEASYGLPSIQLPSGNPRRATVYGMSRPGSDHPLDVLLQGRAISVDVTKPGLGTRAMRVSSTDIPTAEYLRQGLTRKNTTQILDDTLAEARRAGKTVRLAALDVETGGVGPYDQVRSLSIGYYDLTGTSSRDAIQRMSLEPTSRSNVHMIVPEMESVRAGRPGEAAIGLGTRTFQVETRSAGGIVHNLTTEVGRSAAAANYERQIRDLLDPNTFIVGNKVGSFDIPKIVNSAAALDEFMNVPERAALLRQLQEKLNSGTGVIDVTQLAGEHIFQKMGELQQLAEARGASIESMLDEAVGSILSPEAALKAGRFGESVKPRSIESILLTTDLLERLTQTPEGYAIVDKLSSGAHISDIDLQLSAAIIKGVQTDEMELLTSGSRGTIAGVAIDPAYAAAVEQARVSLTRFSAMTPTTNLANIEEVSDQVFGFISTTTDPRITQGIRIQTARGYQDYNAAVGSYQEVIGGVATNVPEPVATRRIRDTLNAAGRAAPGPAGESTRAKVLSLGISASEAGQMERTLQYADVVRTIGAPGPSSMIDLLDTEAGQEAFVDSLSATRRFAGMPHLQERNLLVEGVMGRSMRHRQGVFDETNASAMIESLHFGKAGMEMLDPTIRSNFVAASSITANVAFNTESGRRSTAMRVATQQYLMANPTATPDMVQAHLATLSSEQIESLAVRAQQITGGRNLLSEMGVITFEEAKPSIMRAGGSGELGRIRLTQQALSDIRVRSTPTGAFDTPLLESALFERAGLGKMHMSEVLLQDNNRMVNLVMGEGRLGRTEARSLSEGLVDMWKRKIIDEGLSDDTLIDTGIFKSKEEIANIRGIIQAGSASIEDKLIAPIAEQFSQHGGPIRGTVTGDVAEGLASLQHSLSQSIGNDQVGVSRGMVLRMAGTDEGLVYAVPGMTKAAEAHAASVGISMPDAAQILQDRDIVLAKAESNTGFRNMIKRAFSRHRVDEGIAGTSVGADRVARDASIREMVTKIKPSAYKVGIGVAALSAGYYLARRGRDRQLYEQVMHEQPTENPGLVQQANYDMQDATMIDSIRRDPLVTAGVVGNLDRNKIGHTMMGPNKYNHLFGG